MVDGRIVFLTEGQIADLLSLDRAKVAGGGTSLDLSVRVA
jgi:hypothetical protein